MMYFKISLNTKGGEIKSLGRIIFKTQYSAKASLRAQHSNPC
jgi:hypothetical protein